MTTTASPPADIRNSDLAFAAILAVAVLVGSGFALAHARLEPELPDIDPGLGVPIAVRPVADFSSAGSGVSNADDARPVVPRAWRRKAAKDSTRRAPKKAASKPVAPVVPDESVPIEPNPAEPPPEEPIEDPNANVEPPDEAPTEPESAEPESAEPESAEPESAEPESAEPDTAEPDNTEAGGENPGEAPTEGDGGSGGTDPLLERAIAFYRARLVGWFSARFRVTGSGLSSAELAKYRVRVHIDLGEDLRIDDYRILSSDHPAFEKAARTTLDKLRGEKLPPPPENFPGAVQRQLTVTFTCAEDTCD